jgi:hypothetical protein
MKSGVDLFDLLRFDKIKNAFKEDYLIITGPFNNYSIISSLPLYSSIFMELCPGCVPDIKKIIPLLDTGCVFPILIADYSSYHDSFVKEIIKYPHFSNYEFFTLRNMILRQKSEDFICEHCIDERFSKIKIKGLASREEKKLREKIDRILNRLLPFSSSQEDLLRNIELIIKKGDYNKLNNLIDISEAISNVRTSEAFSSPLYIADNIKVYDRIDKYMPMQLNHLLQFSEYILLEGLDLEAPADLNIAKYIEIIMNNRDAIKGIAKHIITKASNNDNIDKIAVSNLLNEIVKLNDEVRRLQKSKKYRLLKIGTNILSANKWLISTLICAVAFGFKGNILGCATSTSAGIVGKMLKDNQRIEKILEKIKIKGPTQELRDIILNSLEPSLQKLLAIYLDTDLKVIQTMRVREKIQEI